MGIFIMNKPLTQSNGSSPNEKNSTEIKTHLTNIKPDPSTLPVDGNMVIDGPLSISLAKALAKKFPVQTPQTPSSTETTTVDDKDNISMEGVFTMINFDEDNFNEHNHGYLEHRNNINNYIYVMDADNTSIGVETEAYQKLTLAKESYQNVILCIQNANETNLKTLSSFYNACRKNGVRISFSSFNKIDL